MKIKILKDYNELSYTVADIVEEQIKREPLSRFILPTGSTPLSLYKKLVSRDLDWSHVATYNLDEYVDNTCVLVNVPNIFISSNTLLFVPFKAIAATSKSNIVKLCKNTFSILLP